MNKTLRFMIGVWLIMGGSWWLGSLLILAALHNWSGWPGVIWFLLGAAVVVLGVFVAGGGGSDAESA